MITTENDCLCCEVCYGCGAKRAMHYHCDRCGDDEEKLYCLDDTELCRYCTEKALRGKETTDGICDLCGDECLIYSDYGLCEECLWENLETVEEF